jgi:GNAT superfamily N-acetyltransferase
LNRDEQKFPLTKIGIRRITAAETRALRQQVLRPKQRPEEQVYPNDDAPDTLHAGAFRDGTLVGIATVFRDVPPGEPNPRAWRLRGMAVLPEMQRQGVGRALVEFCVEHIRAQGGEVLWCNGRTSARAFYESAGFRATGACSGEERCCRRCWHPQALWASRTSSDSGCPNSSNPGMSRGEGFSPGPRD